MTDRNELKVIGMNHITYFPGAFLKVFNQFNLHDIPIDLRILLIKIKLLIYLLKYNMHLFQKSEQVIIILT